MHRANFDNRWQITLTMIFGLAAASCTVAAPVPNWGQRQTVPFEALQQQFADPGRIYAPFVFWFWDEPLHPDKMAEMSRVLCSQGFNPGYAHARMSMVGTANLPDDEWLGETWFTAFGAALNSAETQRSYLGYCDEYWWPSLQAHGRVLKAHPELCAESLRWEATDVQGGTEVRVPASFFAVAAQLDQPLVPGIQSAVKMGKWIWDPAGTEIAHTCWFRRIVSIPAGRRVARAVIKITADNGYVLTLNAKKIGEGDDWKKAGSYDVTGALAGGRNVVAIEAQNVDGPFGLLVGMAITLDDGTTMDVRSDATWQTSLKPAEGWQAAEFGAEGWSAAREIADSRDAPWRYAEDGASHRPAMIRSKTLRLVGDGASFVWKAPPDGAWRVYAFALYFHPGADGGQVNYIDSRLAPAFIETALEPYARRLGDRLGRSIPGDFIDNEGDYGWGLAWSGTLEKRYRERFGRDIRLWMPMMVDVDAEGTYARARWEWFDLVSDVYAETFRALTDWHEARGMYTTAHVWEEGIPPQVSAVGDHFKFLRAVTMPGQDCLGRKALRVRDFKEVESVAEFQNARAATELMGAGAFEGTPWGTFTPAFLKQAVNAVTAWGMSHIIPHGVFTARKLTGNPWPPDWYAENPMFPYFHLWNDFARRASYVNSMGHAVPDVLLYNPMESAWINADATILDVGMWSCPENTAGGKRINAIDRVYAKAIDDLTAARVEFLASDAFYLSQMEVKDGKLVRGEFAFGTLVLPAVDVLRLEVARKIVQFARAGGWVVSLGELPSGSTDQGMGDLRMQELVDALRTQPTFVACGGGLKPVLDQKAAGLESPVQFVSGAFPMLQHRRRIAGRDFFWLANNADQWQVCEISLRGVRGAASIWDCETGAIHPVSSADVSEGSRLALVFKPYEAYWLVVDSTAPARLGPPWRKPQTQVVATIEGPWRVSYDARLQPAMEFPMAPAADFAVGVQRPLEDWKAWGLQKFSGLIDYTNTINLDRTEDHARLDLGTVYHVAQVWVNGQDCGSRMWGPHVFDVAPALCAGPNEIRVRVANLINNSYGELEPSGLLGPVRIIVDH